ncbi:MAG: uracil-DNA glycosylase [Thermoprotei archaeon]|nr:MAG: uracil-DNA glycosylase [Thermoprotei archaeon]
MYYTLYFTVILTVASNEDKFKLYTRLRNDVLACRKCDLWRTRTNAVPGEGNLNSFIMFIGEAPGRQEDIEGRPFVGPAGKLLTSLIESIGLRREEVYITNVVKCRPPGNRDPRPSEITACSPYLNFEIKLLKPKLIVTLGRHSTSYILGLANIRASGISKVRGNTYEVTIFNLRVLVFPTYHPAAALYNPRLRDILEKDFARIGSLISRILSVNVSHKGKQLSLDEFL